MTVNGERGFARHDFASRYDVSEFQEDAWHDYAAERTADIVKGVVRRLDPGALVLNAGCGVYSLEPGTSGEVRVDVFEKPLKVAGRAVCADVQRLPFGPGTFDLVVCVGEVLGYCDPAAAIRELARVLARKGVIVCDFASSRSFRRWFTRSFGRAADVVVSQYNGTPERSWVYDPAYIANLVGQHGIAMRERIGTHTWSALGQRLGLSVDRSMRVQRRLRDLPLPCPWAELVTFVGEKP